MKDDEWVAMPIIAIGLLIILFYPTQFDLIWLCLILVMAVALLVVMMTSEKVKQ